MSLLIVDTLDSEKEYGFSLSLDKNMAVRAISFWLYLNDPSLGSEMTIKLKDGDDNILHSEVIAIADIKTSIGATSSYSHGKYIWTPSSQLLLTRGDYKLTLEQTLGYGTVNYIAWCKDWESPYFSADIEPSDDSEKPYYVRVYSYKDRETA